MMIRNKVSHDVPTIGFGILSHKSLDQLNMLVDQLLSYPGSYIFVHIDKKADFSATDVVKSNRVIVIAERISASWGDISLVDITLVLLKHMTTYDIKLDWISIHSGLDLAIRPISEFADFLVKSHHKAYVDAKPLPILGLGQLGGLERVRLSYPKFMRQRPKRYSLVRYTRYIYQQMFVRGLIKGRQIPKGRVFLGGSQWFTLRNDIAEDMLSYVENTSDYYAFFEDTLIPDEIFFPTLINILYKNNQNINYSDNLRYIDWSGARGADVGAPATLVSDDILKIESSANFFARKFDLSVDREVIEYFRNKVMGPP